MTRLRPAPAILTLLPALALIPLLAKVFAGLHGGGLNLLADFVQAACQPSLQNQVLQSAWQGLQVTVVTALLSWVVSSIAGLVLGLASSTVVWSTFAAPTWAAVLIRRVLAVPRAIHELIWGLLLLQVLGLSVWVAILAITIPYTALVARVVADQIDSQPRDELTALCQLGAPPISALATAFVPPMAPVLISYGGYRLECALRGATLLGVFGLGGLGTDLQLTLQSLQFREMWTGLWMLAAVMFSLEKLLRWWRLRLKTTGMAAQQLLQSLTLMLFVLLFSVCWLFQLGLDAQAGLSWHGLPWPTLDELSMALLELPWLNLISETLGLTLLAAAIAIGLPPLGLLLLPNRFGMTLQTGCWALLRLIPAPLTALLLLLSTTPSLAVAALALGLHNLGIMGRLLREGLDQQCEKSRIAFRASGAGSRSAWLYGCLSPQSPGYLAYAAYRTDVMLRETAVVGLVGGAGLGWQLLESLSAFNWAQVLLVLIVFVTLTLIGESISDQCRNYWLGTKPLGPAAVALQS